MTAKRTFQLRYVGPRFADARLPVEVLSDLQAFRDLLVAYAKELWRNEHQDRKRLPKGFDKSISLDLVAVEQGSAVPKLEWNADAADALLPGFASQMEDLVDRSYGEIIELIARAASGAGATDLGRDQLRALNRLGAGLGAGEKIEFVGSQAQNGNVVYLDARRRKTLITNSSATYQTRYESTGILRGVHVDRASIYGQLWVDTEEYREIELTIDAARVEQEFDGNVNKMVEFAIQIETDTQDNFKRVVDVFDVELIDPTSGPDYQACRARLSELGSIKDGWHNGAGVAVVQIAVDNAAGFLEARPGHAKAYRIYPTEDGGVLIEFEARGWDYSVEFCRDGFVEMFGVEIDGVGELSARRFPGVDDAFLKLFDDRAPGGG
ncbi:MAG: hypothetical protein ING19_01475 [Azospirillum sp.]|nr:hypothetical protein [Azospirillum sp.]